MVPIHYLLLGASALVLLSVLASKASSRLGVPALLLFLAIGMLAGSDGPGGIYFDDPWLAQLLGIIALSYILFASGLDTRWERIRPVLAKGLVLSTLSVLLTALLLGLFATWVLRFSILEGLLLGAIVSSTDAAAVFSVLRSKTVSLREGLEPLLELESGSNDPMAVFLTIGMIRLLVEPRAAVADLIGLFAIQMIIGAVVGYAVGRGMVVVVNRLRLEYRGLYSVLTLSLVPLVYGLAATLGGNGFLAVYLAGITMGNNDFIHKKSLTYFHDGIAWLMQIAMFLTLGLLVFPSRVPAVIPTGIVVSAFLMLVARPLSVFVALLFYKMDLREKLMISWVGLRGAAPIILATFPLVAGISKADMIFNLVFFVVLTSVLLQGTSVPLVARLLRVDAPLVGKRQHPLEFVPTSGGRNDLVELAISEESAVVGRQIVELGLPPGALIVLISKEDGHVVPSGSAILEAGETVLVLADQESLKQVRTVFGAKNPILEEQV